ncbi:Protein CBG03974 [Caenorhabditis briggsae]|uniref:NTF2-like domain-containing protein n=2 Tax=Caenorhabditis briggsae TaxID=6238 RepID=A0AAE9IYP3_CAEBR|nr:Protein CBG03974 [Caenorhabditis briggsae]ULU10590.1 hypothetical protein L3Y34_014694 [Caenorhabditis briggsae]UMM11527.1 hypothetical protein L5515_000767 [Caenorhabditis briggsae]CAP24773.1 Protein CBG03974 [Caenorhabditis briggsae]
MKLQLFVLLSTLLLLLVSAKQTKIPEDVAKGEQLVRKVLKGIELRDRKIVGSVFEDSFVYEGCKNTKLGKKEVMDMIGSTDLPMARVLESNTQILYIGSHKFGTITTDFGRSTESEFVVSKNWKLQSGRMTSC